MKELDIDLDEPINSSDLLNSSQQHSSPDAQKEVTENIRSLRKCDQKLQLFSLLENAENRDQVYWKLKQNPIHDTFGEIVEMSRKGNPELRKVAIRLAGDWKVREAVPVLLDILFEPIPCGPSLPYYSTETLVWQCLRSLPYFSAEALGRIGDSVAIPKLKLFLTRGFNFTAVEALYRLGDVDTARQYLLDYMKTGTSDNLIDALDLISEQKDPYFTPYVLTLLPSQEAGSLMRRGVRAADYCGVGDQARYILYDMATNEHIPALIKLAPEMQSDRLEDIEDIIECIQESVSDVSPDILQQVRKLAEDSEPSIARIAKRFLERKTENA